MSISDRRRVWIGQTLGLPFAGGVLLAAVVACTPAGPQQPPQEAATVDRAVSTATTSAKSSERGGTPPRAAATVDATPPTPDPLVAMATADAANRTGAGQGDVRIVRVERRDWPDRSLGCPRPGLGYAQAITPGFIIVAEAGDERLEYHTDHAQVVLCSSQSAPD